MMDATSYVAGLLPVPNWPDGNTEIRLPDSSTREVTIESGVASGVEVFVWNVLSPDARIHTLAPSQGAPGYLRLGQALPTPKAFRVLSGTSDADTDEYDPTEILRIVVARVLKWLGTPCSIGLIWSILEEEGIPISLNELAAWVATRYHISDEGLVTRINQADIDPALAVHAWSGWDHKKGVPKSLHQLIDWIAARHQFSDEGLVKTVEEPAIDSDRPFQAWPAWDNVEVSFWDLYPP